MLFEGEMIVIWFKKNYLFKKNTFKNVLALILIGLATLSLFQGLKDAILEVDGSQDFQWGPSRALLEHKDPYASYIDFSEGRSKINPYILAQAPNYPVSAYIFLWPYAIIDWKYAKMFWAISNVVFTALILLGMQKLYPLHDENKTFLLIVLVLLSIPYRNVIANGQHILFCLATFIWSLLLTKRSKMVSGLLLAMSWLKYTVTFPLTLFFISKKDYKPIIAAIIIHCILTVFVGFWIQQSPINFFLSPIKVGLLATGIGDMDVRSIVSRIHAPAIISEIFFVVLLILMLYLVLNYRQKNDLMLMIFLAMMSYALFFHLKYDRMIFIFLMWSIFREGAKNMPTFILLILMGLLWYIQRVPKFLPQIEVFTYINSLLYISAIFVFYFSIGLVILNLKPNAKVNSKLEQ